LEEIAKNSRRRRQTFVARPGESLFGFSRPLVVECVGPWKQGPADFLRHGQNTGEDVMLTLIKAEPVAFQGVIQTVLALAVAFGIGLDGQQVGALLAATAALLSFLTRTQVTPMVNPKGVDGAPLTKGVAAAV
jgi:hypothetical protein